ncbi:hypothetical protein GS399_06610 [Pedobacter sp. HMF7647]|uniref:N-acetyltransferase domain-containing protein n=1 Tax=Hufsiella arboris TaxID=2695275 RepID=A0A7K1Y976_9SPHI|nr:GNAT family N-acetyltransferase [Hufsiella arboris]MXV50639.1 hypothetical protein [Hufsiella arboris]
MQIHYTSSLYDQQLEEIRLLWNSEYPESLVHPDGNSFREYLNTLIEPSHYLLSDEFGQLKGWAVTFTRDESKWFALILDSSIHRKGYGKFMLDKLKQDNQELNAWAIDQSNTLKSDGAVYLSPLDFYLKNGFRKVSDVRIENEKMSAVKIVWSAVE